MTMSSPATLHQTFVGMGALLVGAVLAFGATGIPANRGLRGRRPELPAVGGGRCWWSAAPG